MISCKLVCVCGIDFSLLSLGRGREWKEEGVIGWNERNVDTGGSERIKISPSLCVCVSVCLSVCV